MKKIVNVNRRSAIKTIGAFGITSTLVSAKAFGQTKKADGFALVGASTPFEVVKTALEKNIVAGLGLTLDYAANPEQMTTLDGYRLLITFHYGPFTVEQEKMVQTFVRNGGDALFLHNSTDIARRGTGILRDVMGGYWLRHTDIRPYRVKITNRDHPITQGVQDFVVTGEHHYNQYDKDPRYVFMNNESIDGWSYNNIEGDKHYDSQVGDLGFGPSCFSGWAYDYGKGRVCFMAPGHTLEILMNPEFVKLQQNAVRWCLKQI
ncbi:MAG: ThuA domain-containing protein [Candidatus Latescibacteria bacterium]|nr:ThuA domain-containing protein [Candidatus Latescibacterota bacterium]